MMHQKETISKANSFFPLWVRQRELRQRLPIGHSDAFCKSLYSSISRCHSWGGGETSTNGALFSLDFSPDGTLLVAGCEKNSSLMFDPLSRRLIHTIHNAHESGVTNVKFLDSRIFATGSIDKTVSLWDTRNLKYRFGTLLQHTGMIGNIEFSQKDDLLITSGVDGIIYMWDKKNGSIKGEYSNHKIMAHDLLRLRLNPDETKMIISTGSGYILIVHELDLNRFAEDLNDPKLEILELSFMHQATYSVIQNWSRFLSRNRRRNRVEIVADFPNAGAVHVISALEIHPQGWSAFSRSKSDESGQEWTCVHDIQERESFKGGTAPQGRFVDQDSPCAQRSESVNEVQCSVSGDRRSIGSFGRGSVSFFEQSGTTFPLKRGAPVSPLDTARVKRLPSVSPNPLELAGLGSKTASCRALDLSLPRSNPSVAHYKRRVQVRFPRLTHYIDEPYSMDWYIEDLGVSADGRLVCSPLDHGIRLFAFTPECSDQSVSWCGRKPRHLYELSKQTFHSASVICTKFSPRHCVLVSGCLEGKLAWYQPVV